MERTDYARIADRYDDNADRLRIADDLTLAALVALPRTRPVRALDLGCGTGNYLVHHAKLGAHVEFVGIDRSPDMLARAKAKLEGSTIELCEGSAEALPFDAGRFDYVTTHFAFHHFEDKPKALDEIARVLAPGGTLRCVNIVPSRMRDWWLYTVFPGALVLDLERFWLPEILEHQLEKREFVVETAIEARRSRTYLSACLPDVERREISELAILKDAEYQRGLRTLRQMVADDPSTSVRSELTMMTMVARRISRESHPSW
ncbi:MAG: methyltransferase domain-containing protein [Polyangiaceae bacterium]